MLEIYVDLLYLKDQTQIYAFMYSPQQTKYNCIQNHYFPKMYALSTSLRE